MKQSIFLSCGLVTLLFFASGCKKENPVNKVPVANAGTSKNITLYTDSVTLSGSGTDADGQVVSYLWSQVSGPAATSIINPGNASTLIKGFKQGTYIFQLMVTDDMGATGVDTAMVIVNAAQVTTLTLQPANSTTEAIVGVLNGVAQTNYTDVDMPVMAWTSGGLPLTVRPLIKFDLSSIPSNATIISANLYLYSYPAPTLNGNFIDANFGTANSFVVQQVTSNWTASTVTWHDLPGVTATNQVIVPHTTQSALDLNLNVTPMVSSMVSGHANYGFFMKLQNETYYNSRIFVASYNTTYPAKRPKLVVVYQ